MHLKDERHQLYSVVTEFERFFLATFGEDGDMPLSDLHAEIQSFVAVFLKCIDLYYDIGQFKHVASWLSILVTDDSLLN